MNDIGGLSLRDAVGILYRRMYILKFVAVLLPLAVLAVCLVISPVYESTAKVMVTAKKETSTLLQYSKDLGPTTNVSLNVDETDLNSEIEILRSPDLWIDVVKKIGVNTLKPKEEWVVQLWLEDASKGLRELMGQKEPAPGAGVDRDVLELARELSKNFKVVAAPKSKVLDLSFKFPDSEMVRTILDTLLEQYIPYHTRVYALPGAEHFFSEQGELYRERYEKAERTLVDFKHKWGISLAEKQKSELIMLIRQIQDALVDVNANLSQYRSILVSVKNGLLPAGQLSPTAQRGGENTFLNVVATQLLRAEQKHLQTSQVFLGNSRDVQDTVQMLKDLQKRYEEAIQGEAEILQAKKESLEESLRSKEVQLGILEEKSEEARRLQLAATIAKDRYLQYAAKEEEARIESLKSGNKLVSVTVIGKPFTRPDPVFPRTGLFVLGSFIMAIPFGIALILIATILDHTFDRPEELEAVTGLPVLAVLGKVRTETSGRAKGASG